MNSSLSDSISAYLRELSAHRGKFALCFLLVAAGLIFVAFTWPKSYTSSATIYADNSNILQPLMEGNAVSTSIVDQAQMAQEIVFSREFHDEVLTAAGMNPALMTAPEKEDAIRKIQDRTEVSNVGRRPASLIEIAHTDRDPIKAFSIAQKYTSLFIAQSVIQRREESRGAFDFIQNQVNSYHRQLKQSEESLSQFRSNNNNGTLAAANSRLSGYQADIERLELEMAQLDTEIASVEAEMNGQREVSRDLSEVYALRSRINSLQTQLDTLRSRYKESYPDVVQLKTQIQDLMAMLESGQVSGVVFEGDDLDTEGTTPLHQELRSQLAALRTTKQSKAVQLQSIRTLMERQTQRIREINQTEAELAELTRDYNVTRDVYNDLSKQLENARISMQLDEQQQGVTFKVQESAVIPTRPDGFGLAQLLPASLVLALGVPFGLLFLYMELDPRLRSESSWSEEWPPLLITVPPLKSINGRRLSDKWFLVLVVLASVSLYGGATAYGLMSNV